MTYSEPAVFDRVGAEYSEYLGSVRGWVRQEVVRHNLFPCVRATQTTLEVPSLSVLDFGGGNAQDALWLAEMGHDVTIVDISEEELGKGQVACAQADPETADRVHFLHGDVSAVERLPKASFQLALSHGVLMYELENPERQIRALANAVSYAGRLSLLTKGLYGAMHQKFYGQDMTAVRELQTTGRFQNNLGVTAQAYTPEQLEKLVVQNGFHIVEKTFGVRIFSDNDQRMLDELSPEEKSCILDEEIRASRDPHILSIGQMLHQIAIKL